MEEVPVVQAVVQARERRGKPICTVLNGVGVGDGRHRIVQAVVQAKQAVPKRFNRVRGAFGIAEVEPKAVALELLRFRTDHHRKARGVIFEDAQGCVGADVVVAGVVFAPVSVGEAVGAVERGVLVRVVFELAVVVPAIQDDVQLAVRRHNDLARRNLASFRLAPLDKILVGQRVVPAVELVVAFGSGQVAVLVERGVHHEGGHVGQGRRHGRANAARPSAADALVLAFRGAT